MLEIKDSIYKGIKNILEQVKNKVYKVSNSIMVETYWSTGRIIVEKQGDNNKAEYGTVLIKTLSKKIRKEFGKGFIVSSVQIVKKELVLMKDTFIQTQYFIIIFCVD